MMKAIQLASQHSAPIAFYQQALCDFGIANLIEQISNFSDVDFDVKWMHLEEQEIEALAVLLIQQVTASLNGKLIAGYLNVLRNIDAIVDLPATELKPLQNPIALPSSFPQQASAPLFLYGNPVRWIPLNATDEIVAGIVIGCFFAYAKHRGQWAWKYLIWLKDALGSGVVDTAWEEDIEFVEEEKL
jgi:hypothetical protein